MFGIYLQAQEDDLKKKKKKKMKNKHMSLVKSE